MSAEAPSEGILTLVCPDEPGTVLAVADFLAEHGNTILESQQYGDPDSGRFFMRVRFARIEGRDLDVAALASAFETLAVERKMRWELVDAAEPLRVLVMVSRYAHCLNELLFRNSIGDVRLDVVGIVSNHPDLKWLADNYGVPFWHIPVSPGGKSYSEAELIDLVRQERVDLVVLARYMQILSDDLCAQLAGRAINIHHSVLPSFKGARPYQQAHARGVKVIGATAHYVTADLDEGPIIEQEIARVDHAMTADEFVRRGRSNEARALTRAVAWHAERRVLLNGASTVVLR